MTLNSPNWFYFGNYSNSENMSGCVIVAIIMNEECFCFMGKALLAVRLSHDKYEYYTISMMVPIR